MDAGSASAPSVPGAPRGGLRAFPSAGGTLAAIAIAASFSSSPRIAAAIARLRSEVSDRPESIAADAFERSVAEDSSAEDSSTRRETW